jgi:hypothetical protein
VLKLVADRAAIICKAHAIWSQLKIMDRAEVANFERQRFGELKQRLLEREQALKEERHRLWLREKETQEEYPVWERLEMLTSDILGYVSQLASRGATRQPPDLVIEHLHHLSIFEVDSVVKWYSVSADEYPQIKQYFELLDYVRLLALEYVERYRLTVGQLNR